MSKFIRSQSTARSFRHHAPIFAALGDETRLYLVSKLCDASPQSISDLSRGQKLTRQAITKHLRVLENVGLVRNTQNGRVSLFALKPDGLGDAKEYLERISKQWDDALGRLKTFLGE